MSGRIPAYRHGFDDLGVRPGYDCVGIPPISIPCTDCDTNEYLRIPVQLGTTTDSKQWKDYSAGLPLNWDHPCCDKYDGAFLEVEYPDVPSVSVRGIGFKPGYSSTKISSNLYTGCYDWHWMDPASLPPTSKGYVASGADMRWFYFWWDKDESTWHYSDDAPDAASIKSPWTVPVKDVDETMYGPFENINTAAITFEYCEECPREDYKGPFELYLRRDPTETSSSLQVYPGRIIKTDHTVIEVPSKYISVYSNSYVYYDVDEATEPSGWSILSSPTYPVKEGATDTQYYLVIGQVLFGGHRCDYGISGFKQLLFGDYSKGGQGGGSFGYFYMMNPSGTTMVVTDGISSEALTCGYVLYNGVSTSVDALVINVTSNLYIWAEVTNVGSNIDANIQISGTMPSPEFGKLKVLISRVFYADGTITYWTQEHLGLIYVDVLALPAAIPGYLVDTPMGFTIDQTGAYKWIEISTCPPPEEVP